MNLAQNDSPAMTAASAGQPGPNRASLPQLYGEMLRINTVEKLLLDLFGKGRIRGTVHTCLGQEGTACGILAAADRERDIVCSNHRGHGHFLAYGGDAKALIAEIMGRADGLCAGAGGSQHLQYRNFYSNGILGGMMPVATGMALAEKLKNSGALVIIFIGDGALAEGAVYEALNMASLWSVPLLMVVEDNGYAQSTPKALEHSGLLERRGEPFGIPTTVLDGNDVEAVYEAAMRVMDGMRTAPSPHILYCRTYRLAPHSKGDDLRDPAEIAGAEKVAPLVRTRSKLAAPVAEKIEQRVADEIGNIMAALDG
jgi:TPP-dependent pyruvate/acetoin dehydrogenase alpha subunit